MDFSLRKMLEVRNRPQQGIGSGKKEATPDWRLELTPFSQMLVQIPDQAEGNQACGAIGAIAALVLLLQRGLKLCPQLLGQLLWLQLPTGAQSAQQSLAGHQEGRHVYPTLRSGDLETEVPPAVRRKEPGVRGAGRGGAEGRGGGDAARGSVGRGRNAARPRVGSCVSSRAGARTGHGGLCGPASPGCGQSLVVPVADRGPGAEAALCGGWSRSLPASGLNDDAEAPFVPVRDGAGGRAWSLVSVFPASEEARRPGRLRVIGDRPGRGSRPGADLRCLGLVPGAEKSPGLCRAGSEGELVPLPE